VNLASSSVETSGAAKACSFALTDEQRAMLDVVRSIAQVEFRPRAARFMDGTFPWENIKRLAEVGILGMAVPADYGGSNMGVLETALVLEEIAKVCYPTAMAVLGEVGTQTRIISTFAPDSLKRRILPGVCTGDCILAICMTEPHAGTDVANYRTNGVINGETAIVNGVKTLISRAEEAGAFVVFSRINGVKGREGIGCIVVERGTPGLSCTGRYHTIGGEHLCEVRFENCEVPVENVIIKVDGFRLLLNAFNTQRCLNPSISLGLAEGAFEEAVGYVRDRTIFDRRVGDFQGIRWKLADMYKDIEVGRSILYRACATANPFPDPFQAAIAKVYCNEMAIRVTSEALQLHGGYGFTDEFAVSRFFRGARYGTLGGGTTESLRDLIGNRIISDFDALDGFLGMGTF
jgi:alkylation response protein AidB-like acyl-CoA dehydrogenase